MTDRPSTDPETAGRIGRLLAGWTRLMHRRARWVIAVAALATALSGVITFGQLGINTDTADMIAPEVPFRRDYEDFKRAFPQFVDAALVVVEAPSAGPARDAARALAERLTADGALFRRVDNAAGDPFFRRNGLLYLDTDELLRLAQRLADAQPLLATLNADMTLRGFAAVMGDAARAIADGDAAADLTPVLDPIARVAEARLAGRDERIDWSALIAGDGSSGAGRAILLVQPRPDFASLSPSGKALDAIRAAVASLPPAIAEGVTVRITGAAALADDELASVRNGAVTASLLSIVLVTALLFAGLGSGALVFATVVTLLVGLVWTGCFAALAVGSLNLISVAFAVLFIGLGIDFGIHYALRGREGVDAGRPVADALPEAAAGVGRALALTAIAAALGFYAFVPTTYLGLSELGMIAGTSMLIAFAATFTVLPALIAFVPPKPRSRRTGDLRLAAAGAAIGRRNGAVLAASLALAVAALAVAPRVSFDFNPLRLKNPADESVAAFRDLAGDPATSPYTLSVMAGDPGEAARLAARLEALPSVDKALTLANYVPADQEAKLRTIEEMAVFLTPIAMAAPRRANLAPAERTAAYGALVRDLVSLATAAKAPPETKAAARRTVDALVRFRNGPGRTAAALADLEARLIADLPYRIEDLALSIEARPVGIDDLPAAIRDRMTATDGRMRIEVRPKGDVSENEAMRRFVAEVAAIAPNATGTPAVLVGAGEAVLRSFERAAAIAFAAVTALLAAMLRSVRDYFWVMAPLALAGALTAASTVALGIPFNFANVIVVPLLFGIGVAGAVHIVMRRRAGEPIDRLLATSTPRAVIFSALTTLASFGTLAVSDHRGMASMGILLTLAVLFTLFATLVFLPALMARTGAAAPRGRAP
jgi:hypothetical protein